MAITRAQAYQQLVRKPSGEERPGYRGEGGYQEGKDSGGKGNNSGNKGGNDPSPRDRYMGLQGKTGVKDQSLNTGGEGLEKIRQQKIKDKIKEELLLTPIGRNKVLNKVSLFNNRYQRDRLINLAKKRADQKYRDLEDYVVGDTDMEYDFTGLPEGLKDLKTTTGTRPNLYDVNPTMNIPSTLSLFQDKIRPDTQVTAQNTLQKARDYMDIVNNASNMTNKDIRDTITDLGNRGKTEDQINPREGNGGQPILPRYAMAPVPSITEQEPELTELQQMLADRGSLARRFAANGGIMNADVVGGEFDFESARQMYGLGKLVKKATRAVKKVASSPIGKAALLYTGAAMAGSLGAGKGLFSKGMFAPGAIKAGLFGTAMPTGFSGPGVPGLFTKLGLTKTAGSMMPSAFGAITAASLLPMLGIGTGDESEDEAQAILDNTGIDINKLRTDETYRDSVIARRFKAEGGPAEGKEPVAKKVMPLLDLEGQEMDFRSEGGFVPIGRMEKADDVPARLSKNEFVFTADAVRNAGDGDIDKGAEVMYNMMKHLEDGGDVSEESQGLEGARNMFQTSQRLEEVL